MPTSSKLRTDRLRGSRTKAEARRNGAVRRRREVLEAEIAMGWTIRRALLRAGVDPLCAARLVLAEEAATELAALPAAAEPTIDLLLHDGDFSARIAALSQLFAGGRAIDFANASFAELYAWALVQKGSG